MMANRECNGERFKISSTFYWRCFWDHTVIEGEVADGAKCPVCQRSVDGDDCRAEVRLSVQAKVVPRHGEDAQWFDVPQPSDHPEPMAVLESACHALRSYEHGNASRHLAKDVADDIDKLLKGNAS
jgi:hypothetical protein